MEGLPTQKSAENHDPFGRGIHPPVPPPRFTGWVPTHSLLRPPWQSLPTTKAGPVPPATGYDASEGSSIEVSATQGLPRSPPATHRVLIAGVPTGVEILLANCLAHGRRQFIEVAAN